MPIPEGGPERTWAAGYSGCPKHSTLAASDLIGSKWMAKPCASWPWTCSCTEFRREETFCIRISREDSGMLWLCRINHFVFWQHRGLTKVSFTGFGSEFGLEMTCKQNGKPSVKIAMSWTWESCKIGNRVGTLHPGRICFNASFGNLWFIQSGVGLIQTWSFAMKRKTFLPETTTVLCKGTEFPGNKSLSCFYRRRF